MEKVGCIVFSDLPKLQNFLFSALCSDDGAQWMNEWQKDRTVMTLRNQLNQLSVTRWPLKPKVWQWVPGRPIRKMQVSRFSGTAAPSTISLFKCLCKDVQHIEAWGGGAIFPMDAQVCHQSSQGTCDFPIASNNICKGHWERVGAHVQWIQAALSYQPLCFLGPGPSQVGASSCSRRQTETCSSCRELGHKCRRNTFLTDVSGLFHNRQTAIHMPSLPEKQNVQVQIVCKCSNTNNNVWRKLRQRTEFLVMAEWVLAKRTGLGEDMLPQVKIHMLGHLIGENVTHRHRILFLKHK